MTKKASSTPKSPADRDCDCNFSATSTDEFINPKYPVLTEQVFRDTNALANGLRIRAYPSGKASYFVERRIRSASGGAKKRIICKVGEKTVEEAREEAKKIISWMASGKDPYVEQKREQEVNRIYTVRDAYNLYMKSRALQNSTKERYERQFQVLSYLHITKKKSWKDINNGSPPVL